MTALTTSSASRVDRRPSVVLPDRRDPRLHTAAVIVSVHVVGITALGFRVSVPQILSAIITAALVDIVLTWRATGQLVWPASGMLTGSGVALILRVTGMQGGDFWSWSGWHYFSLIAGLSVLTKYAIRVRGTHLFNPSNFGLTVAFLLLGSEVIEPLDFWWHPMGPAMVAAYAFIIAGGVVITRRLGLLEMAVAFWVSLAAGLGVLSASGHCMTAAWSPDQVCGLRFWTVLVTSPEILIFLFFMITDPKTAPRSRLGRLAFAVTLALLATLLIAPQATEFGAKVALLGSLVIWSPIHRLFDRALPTRHPGDSGLSELRRRAVDAGWGPLKAFCVGSGMGAILVLASVTIVAAGAPARTPVTGAAPQPTALPVAAVDVSSLPHVEVAANVRTISVDMTRDSAVTLAATLAENLAVEAEAIRVGDSALLTLADGGMRLEAMQAEVDEAIATGRRTTLAYEFDSLRLHALERSGTQSSAALAFDATGSVEEITYDALGREQGRSSSRFASTFVLRQVGGERWLIVDVLPLEE